MILLLYSTKQIAKQIDKTRRKGKAQNYFTTSPTQGMVRYRFASFHPPPVARWVYSPRPSTLARRGCSRQRRPLSGAPLWPHVLALSAGAGRTRSLLGRCRRAMSALPVVRRAGTRCLRRPPPRGFDASAGSCRRLSPPPSVPTINIARRRRRRAADDGRRYCGTGCGRCVRASRARPRRRQRPQSGTSGHGPPPPPPRQSGWLSTVWDGAKTTH